MTKIPSIFRIVDEEFAKEQIRVILIGGFALNRYGVSRQTADVDFLITRPDYEKARGILRKSGYQEDHCREHFARLRSPDVFYLDVDFLFVDEQTFLRIQQEAQRVVLEGREFLVPSVDHLVALKLHAIKNNPSGREAKDLLDIVLLIQVNHMDAARPEFVNLCTTYGPAGIHEKLRLLLKGHHERQT